MRKEKENQKSIKILLFKRVLFMLGLLLVSNISVGQTAYYVDPINGSMANDGTLGSPWKTLEEVISSNLIESQSYTTPFTNTNSLVPKNENAPIKAGDTIVLKSGLHGNVLLQNYVNLSVITIKAAAGETPILEKLKVQAGENWKFEGLSISSEPYGNYINDKLVFLETHNHQGPVSNVEIKNCDIYSAENPWTTMTDWNSKVSDGIYLGNCDNISILDNTIRNVHVGASLRGNNVDFINNEISNFCIDGLRVLGSNQLIEGNTIKNAYKTVAGNHEDAIQSFTTGGIVANTNTIRKNILINNEDPNQPFIAEMQGLGCFDGPFNDWIVENNLVFVNNWNGITLGGANNAKIVNNTVLDPTPLTGNITASRITIRNDNAGNPSTNCIVKNNVMNQFLVLHGNVVISSNNLEIPATSDYIANFVDYNNMDFHLLSTSVLVDAADDSVAPNTDIEGVSRPQGTSSDIGCYEFETNTSATQDNLLDNVTIYPNPVKDEITIQLLEGVALKNVQIYNVLGKEVFMKSNGLLTNKITLRPNLSAGVYILEINTNNKKITHKIIIE